MYKKLFATSLALALGAGVVGVVAAPATATDSNHAAYWQTLEGESCEKPSFSTENSAVNPYTLPEPDDGWEWSNAEEYPGYIQHTAASYRMIINEIVYALTH